MRELPRNTRVGHPQGIIYVADDVADTSAVDTWVETGSISVTPPPVSVEPVSVPHAHDDEAKRLPGDLASFDNEDGEGWAPTRASAWLWPMMLVSLSLVVGVVLALHPRTGVSARKLHRALAQLPATNVSKLDVVSMMNQRVDGIRMARADEHLRRRGYASIPGGVLFTPDTFHSSDGAYDLLLHFHGNVKVVLQSAQAARLNAVVAVINVGTGSAPYEQRYAVPGSYEKLLSFINDALERRGLAHPRLRRVALSGWSAGYGAISTILKERRGVDPLDSIAILDGIHTSLDDEEPGGMNTRRLTPFTKAARAAASGELLFTITCSQIKPEGYASTHQTANYLLKQAEELVHPVTSAPKVPAWLHLPAMRGAVAKEDVKPLQPIVDTHVGLLHVREYKGNGKGDHMSHLFQMGSTVLPELAHRWSAYPKNGLRSGVLLPSRRAPRHR